MSRRSVPPASQIINLFAGLSDEDKRMVMFALSAMSVAPAHFAPTRTPKQEPVRKGKTTEPVCWTCGNPADASGHDLRYISSHPFVASVGKKSSRKGAAKESIPSTGEETESVLAAGTSGD